MSIKLFLITVICFHYAWSAPTASEKLTALRKVMQARNIQAYIIPSEDEHQSEYTALVDRKREWISGFTGSAGEAVVTLTNAALWTDSRYFLRAEKELDATQWKLMKSGLAGVPSINDWLKQQLKDGDRVGENAKLVSITQWKSTEASLKQKNINFVNADSDLIDEAWSDKPPKPANKLNIHNLTYSGETWESKVEKTVAKIKAVGADVYVVTALDEVAWLFNLRSSDIPYNPMFFGYAVVAVNDKPRLYINEARVTNDIRDHLKDVVIRPYEAITNDIKDMSNKNMKIWVSPMSSYAIYSAVSNQDLLLNDKPSPVRSLKAVKNSGEVTRARGCQIRDSVARVKHMYWLENKVKRGERVTEVSSADELERIQGEDPLFRMLSFDSISGVGPHAADIHFSTNEEEDTEITTQQIYLLDAGAQYEDCTTDITRTHHFGKPSKKEILAYTKVLQGSIDLANLVFPRDVNGRLIDVAARSALWKAGLDYGHGTGHGIGYYGGVHEDPPYGSRQFDENYVPGMFQSDEPGYYEDGFFGIRLETDLEVVEAKTPYNFRGNTYLKFEAHSLVPFDRNLMDISLLSRSQIEWLNTYNQRIRDTVGVALNTSKDKAIYEYLLKLTEPMKEYSINSNSASLTLRLSCLAIMLVSIIHVALFKY